MSEAPTFLEIGEEVVRAYVAHVEASAGRGHDGYDHDREMPGADKVQMSWPDVPACIRCASAMYGTEVELQIAIKALGDCVAYHPAVGWWEFMG